MKSDVVYVEECRAVLEYSLIMMLFTCHFPNPEAPPPLHSSSSTARHVHELEISSSASQNHSVSSSLRRSVPYQKVLPMHDAAAAFAVPLPELSPPPSEPSLQGPSQIS
ncbi:hypothetical protein L484_026524 [Morus notabilis]|uniref:Uncharacterized protein n=1 Tax=Morus notabilis TaxID=981085 RepID=W9QP48_9ROSA|nr:hypothetical protein L484_026524 [Morus notabilis]